MQQQQQLNYNPVPQARIKCKLPGPFDNGYADIIIDPHTFQVQPPVEKKKSFFDSLQAKATTLAHKATSVTKNYVDNKKGVLCLYCTAFQQIGNNQLNYYCAYCKNINCQLWTPPRKVVFCGNCSVKDEVDLGTTQTYFCQKCSTWNEIPRLLAKYAVPPNHPNLNDAQSQNIPQYGDAQIAQQQAQGGVERNVQQENPYVKH